MQKHVSVLLNCISIKNALTFANPVDTKLKTAKI